MCDCDTQQRWCSLSVRRVNPHMMLHTNIETRTTRVSDSDYVKPTSPSTVSCRCQKVQCEPEEFAELLKTLEGSVRPHELANPARVMRKAGLEAFTDKIYFHGYERFYPEFMHSYRYAPVTLLELGYHQGASEELWMKFFPRAARLTFVDIAQPEKCSTGCVAMFPPNVVYRGDQGNVTDLHRIMAQEATLYDFIIDDGSHEPHHQMMSFRTLFPFVRPGGIYIVEDIEKSYWTQRDVNVVDVFREAISSINRNFFDRGHRGPDEIVEEVSEIESLSFGQNCIIVKKVQQSTRFFNKMPYRFWSSVKGYQSRV